MYGECIFPDGAIQTASKIPVSILSKGHIVCSFSVVPRILRNSVLKFCLRSHKNIRATEMFKATRSKMASISMLLKMLSISNAPQYCKKAYMNSLITAKVYSDNL